MYKLVILVEALEIWDSFEERWPEFLHLVETLPGLRREATSRVDVFLYGASPYLNMHELFFDSRAEAEAALSSPNGQAAGALLQQMSSGKMTLFFADHREDDLDNIQKYKRTGGGTG
jgi:uncharacterized protein (TIGR02118 family)